MGGATAAAAAGALAAPLDEPELEFTPEQQAAWDAEAHVFGLYAAAEQLLKWKHTVPASSATEAEFGEKMQELRADYAFWGSTRWPLHGAPQSFERGNPRNQAIEAWLRAAGCSSDTALEALLYKQTETGNFMLRFFELGQAINFCGNDWELVINGTPLDMVGGNLRGNLELVVHRSDKLLQGRGEAVDRQLADVRSQLRRVTLAQRGVEPTVSPEEARVFMSQLELLNSEIKSTVAN